MRLIQRRILESDNEESTKDIFSPIATWWFYKCILSKNGNIISIIISISLKATTPIHSVYFVCYTIPTTNSNFIIGNILSSGDEVDRKK